jgi:VanZ family protein
LWLIAGWILILLIIYLSVTPTPIQVPMEGSDKLEHILAYAVLMSWFANLHESSGRRIILAASFVALGVALEFVQGWTGYRSFELADMAAGATGVATGWLVAPPRTPNWLSQAEWLFAR